MAQSVKLKDGSYIDTEGIYDVTQGKTQKELNALYSMLKIYRDTTTAKTYTFSIGTDAFWIFTRYAVLHLFISTVTGNPTLYTLVNPANLTHGIAKSGDTYTFTVSDNCSGGILVVG